MFQIVMANGSNFDTNLIEIPKYLYRVRIKFEPFQQYITTVTDLKKKTERIGINKNLN